MHDFGLLCGKRQVRSEHVQEWLHVDQEKKGVDSPRVDRPRVFGYVYIYIFLCGGFFLHRQREGFQQCVGRLGDSVRRRRPRMFPRRTSTLRPAGEETKARFRIQTCLDRVTAEDYQAGAINQVKVERPEWLPWMIFQFQWIEANLNVSNSNGIMLTARRHHSTSTAANGCAVRGLKQCGAGGGVQRLCHTKGKLNFH